ncbi:Uncharacterised protein [Halioglobus japonicus]|nr:Uncharacterised protein [Halioglobus japonicus]
MLIASYSRLVRFPAPLISLVMCAGALVACSDSNNTRAPTTAVNAASMLEDNVTKNVSQIRVVASDVAGNTTSTTLLTRQQAANFDVLTSADKVELGLLTSSNEQVGVIIFQPEGDEMTLSLPGDGLSPNDVLNLDIVINADLWDNEPRMMAAGLGFSNIIGVPGVTGTDATSEQLAIEAGASWNTVTGCGDVTPTTANYTSAVSTSTILVTSGPPAVEYAGGMPVEFSWPAVSSTVQGTDFLVTLNDNNQVYADVATATPNFDYNERAVVVLFGQFGNRLELDDANVLYPVRIEVVDDGTPMMLIAPNGSLVSAVGMFAMAPGSPYHSPGVGPKLTGAKLNIMSAIGDEGPPGFTGNTPNDGIALYGADAQYRLRVYTTGGYTPDGVVGLKPNQYDNFFQVQVTTDAGELVPLLKAGKEYLIDGKKIEVVGLAELGAPGQVVDGNDCYAEDKDNQIDIVLKGDVEAMRKISSVRVPSQEPAGEHTADGYWQLYNPGGPGNNPTEGTTYTQGSPDHTVEVTIAIDDPMTVTYIDLRVAD